MERQKEILEYLHYHPNASREEIGENLSATVSASTLKRLLTDAVQTGVVSVTGKGKSTRYGITPKGHLLTDLNIETYFIKDTDEREMQQSFNFSLIEELLPAIELFTPEELQHLHRLQAQYLQNIEQLSPTLYDKEMERLGIDLSWKSSQIEGNTYSLLETERLLKDSEEAQGKTKEEAQMLLNHKAALHFIIEEPDYVQPLTVRSIEDIHSLLTRNLHINGHLRSHRVGITGTNYRPLDNEFQIREAMQAMCTLINGKTEAYEKALLALLLLSYIQPFEDGNKRTARIISNALLLAHRHCPLSYRSVDALDYKKAMLIFYEQNSIIAFKKLFIAQVEFAVNTYF